MSFGTCSACAHPKRGEIVRRTDLVAFLELRRGSH